MRSSVVKLDSFGNTTLPPLSTDAPKDLTEEAYERGYNEGANAYKTLRDDTLTTHLKYISTQLITSTQLEQSIRESVLQEISFLIDAAIEAIAPFGKRDRLERLLKVEIERATRPQPHVVSIHCHPEHADQINEAVLRSGAENISVKADESHTEEVKILKGVGSIEIDEKSTRRFLKNLMLELSGGTE